MPKKTPKTLKVIRTIRKDINNGIPKNKMITNPMYKLGGK